MTKMYLDQVQFKASGRSFIQRSLFSMALLLVSLLVGTTSCDEKKVIPVVEPVVDDGTGNENPGGENPDMDNDGDDGEPVVVEDPVDTAVYPVMLADADAQWHWVDVPGAQCGLQPTDGS